MLGLKKRNFYETAFGVWLFITAAKHCFQENKLSKFLFSSLFWKLIGKRFRNIFALLLYLVVNTLPWTQWEFAEKLKSSRKFAIDLDWVFTFAFINSNAIVQISSFGGCKFLREESSERELAESDLLFAVWICFWAQTVFYIECSVDNECLQPQLLMSFQWAKVLPEWLRTLQWTFHCFASGSWTVEHLYNKR